MKRTLTLTIVALLVAALAACQQPQPAPAIDLSAVTANQETIRTELQALKASVNELRQVAVLLDVSVRELGRVDLASLDWTSLTGVIVHTHPPEASLWVEPGPCADDLPRGPALAPRNAHIATTFYPLPVGTHCLSIEQTDQYQATGSTVQVFPGAVTQLSIVAELAPDVDPDE